MFIMKVLSSEIAISIVICLIIAKVPAAQSTTFTFSNNCPDTVWAGTQAGAGTSPLTRTGFELRTGSSQSLPASRAWSGRFWARTGCKIDSNNRFTCTTGDCGTGTVECGGMGPKPPMSLVEVTLGRDGGDDFYDISLVDGFNLPVSIEPRGGRGRCELVRCRSNVNRACPAKLRVTAAGGGTPVACKSACEAFGDANYCCTGEFASPGRCKGSSYSEVFKRECPQAYSYAFDDATSTFTCADADYLVTFCP